MHKRKPLPEELKPNPKRAYSYVLYLLGKRDYSEKEIRKKMEGWYIQEDIDSAILRAQENGFQSDAEFAYIFARKKYGARLMRHKLREKGISDEIIEETLNNTNAEEKAESVFHSKFPPEKVAKWKDEPEFFKKKQKMVRFMFSRGFELDDFKHLIDR